MSLPASSATPFSGTSLDKAKPEQYRRWQTDFLSQALSRGIAGFYENAEHVPEDLRLTLLASAERHVTLHALMHADDFAIDSTLVDNALLARTVAVTALKHSILKKGL